MATTVYRSLLAEPADPGRQIDLATFAVAAGVSADGWPVSVRVDVRRMAAGRKPLRAILISQNPKSST